MFIIKNCLKNDKISTKIAWNNYWWSTAKSYQSAVLDHASFFYIE